MIVFICWCTNLSDKLCMFVIVFVINIVVIVFVVSFKKNQVFVSWPFWVSINLSETRFYMV